MDCGKGLHCLNCNGIFEHLRPLITEVVVSKAFERDYPGFDPGLVLECSHMHFRKLHKFEENIKGNMVFRALVGHTHIVYCVDSLHRLIFLRAFANFELYKHFLSDHKKVLHIILAV